MMDIACIDGVLVPLAEARISVTDDGLLRGDGVFEVLRLYDGAALAVEQHLQRMAQSAASLRLDLDIAAIARDIESLLATAEPGDALVRVVATRGGRRIVLTEPLPALPESITLGYVTFAPVRVLDGVKSLSYAANMQATRLARERGFDEALLVTPHGRVLELPTASFFWVADGQARTPPLSDHILDSITRGIAMGAADATEVSATPADLERADEAFVVSSVWELMPVSRIEERELAVGGSVTTAIAGKVRARIEAQLSRGG
jgi:branched-chain amino acid aminotransferase